MSRLRHCGFSPITQVLSGLATYFRIKKLSLFCASLDMTRRQTINNCRVLVWRIKELEDLKPCQIDFVVTEKLIIFPRSRLA